MARTGESDDNRLTGRPPRASRPAPGDEAPDDDPGPDDHKIDAVNRLLGFLRGDDEG